MKKKGHYIWNRADRVDQSVMPHAVISYFQEWRADLQRDWKYLSKERKSALTHRINREKRNLNESLLKLGYSEYKG